MLSPVSHLVSPIPPLPQSSSHSNPSPTATADGDTIAGLLGAVENASLPTPAEKDARRMREAAAAARRAKKARRAVHYATTTRAYPTGIPDFVEPIQSADMRAGQASEYGVAGPRAGQW